MAWQGRGRAHTLPHFIPWGGRAAGAGKRERAPLEIGRRFYLLIGGAYEPGGDAADGAGRDGIGMIKKKQQEHCCRRCHFLTREDASSGQRFKFTWTKEEREKGQVKHKERFTPMCWLGIWDTGADPTLNTKLEEILDQNRKNKCFFIEHSEGMLFDGADKLRRMRYENQNLKRSLVIATWGLGIAAVAALLNFIATDAFEEFWKAFTGWLGM